MSKKRREVVPPAYKRVTVTLTMKAFDLLTKECERRHLLEGCRVPPARIINELILKHLAKNDDGSGEPRATRAQV